MNLVEPIRSAEEAQEPEPAGPVINISQRLGADHRRLPDREAQRVLRERLRYKHGHYQGGVTLMQRLGNLYRKMFSAD